MITLEFVYVLMGLMFGGIAVVNGRDRRYTNAAFWGLWAETFLFGTRQPPVVSGLVLIAMVLVMMIGKLKGAPPERTTRAEQEASARTWGNWLFVPALTIPAVTLLGTYAFKYLKVRRGVDRSQADHVDLAHVATVVALIVAVVMLKPRLGADEEAPG